MKKTFLIGAALALSACNMAPSPVVSQPQPAQPVDVAILGVNDFHGNLNPTSFRIPDPANRANTLSIQAGGIEYISTVLKDARAQNPNTLFVGVGDLIGGSPLISNALRDEPTIDAMNKLGMSVSVVGNHEFDYGIKELMRMQKGGCDSNDLTRACKYNNTYSGANFQYIAANVVDEKTNLPVFPPYKMLEVGGAKIAFVGAVLKDTPTVVTPSGVAGLKFTDEAEAINNVIPYLKRQGVDAIIALVHQGGNASEAFDVVDCKTLTGDIVDIAKKIDTSVAAIMTGHTHRGYNCVVPDPTGKNRPVVQGDANGHLLQRLDLRVDTNNDTVLSVKGSNVLVDTRTLAKDPAMTAIIDKAKAQTDPIANTLIATLAVPQITRTANAAGESALGDVIADSQLAATQDPAKGGAVIAFMNPGGIRANLPANANPNITYGNAFEVQPFGNILTVMTLTGQQIKDALEQQFDNPTVGGSRILQVSKGFAYSYNTTLAKGSRVSDITLNGKALDMSASYRVTVNNFLADGGDNFTAFRGGTNRLGGDVDIDAFTAYLKANASTLTNQIQGRITKLN